jgi:hypothetical protein
MNFSLESDGADDDDDDDDDDEDNLKRYALDFSLHSTDPNSLPLPHTISTSTTNNNNNNSSISLCRRYVYTIPSLLWFSIQSVRQQARQRRAQLLLQHTERTWEQNWMICLLTYCDATDGGILLVAACMILWMLLLYVQAPHNRGLWIVGGTAFLVRFTTRRVVRWIQNQRQRRRQRQLEQLQQRRQEQELQLNQNHPNSHQPFQNGGSGVELSNGESYLPRLRPRLGSRNLLREDLMLVELQSMGGGGGSGSNTPKSNNNNKTLSPSPVSTENGNNNNNNHGGGGIMINNNNPSPTFARSTADPVIHTI